MTDIRRILERRREELFSFLGELVAIPSVQGEAAEGFPFGKEPAEALAITLEKCRELGFITRNIDNYAGEADLGDAEPGLAILSHLDVVPAGSGWKADPFVMRRENGRLIGRGVIDDKGPAAAAIFAAAAVAEAGVPLKKGLRLVFGTNEENGSADLAYYKSKRALPPAVFTPDGEYPVINGEKGMLRVYFSAEYDGFPVEGGSVINAVPGVCSYGETGFIGKPAHASTPEKGENAITKFLDARGDSHPLLAKLAELFPHGETDGSSCGLGFEDELSGRTTCVLSLLKTEEGRLRGGADIRFPLDRTKAEISEIVCGRLREAGFEVDSCEGVEPHYTDENSPFVKALLRAYERVTGEKGGCLAIGGGTYVHEIEGGVAFGAELPGTEHNMHSPEEFATEEELLLVAEITAEAIIEVCAAR